VSTPSSNIPHFGRKWQLQILTAPEDGSELVWTLGQDAWLPESLRVTFEINEHVFEELWWADISIYNLNAVVQQAVIQEGYEVILSAGYQTGDNYGVIFKGRVFQALWTREEVVDYKLTLHCMAGAGALVNNMISYTALAGSSQFDIVRAVAKTAENPINITQLDSATLGAKVLPRGEVIYGNPKEYLSSVAAGNGFQFWHDGDGINLGDITPVSDQPNFIFSSVPDPASSPTRQSSITYTIVGTPEQIQEGVQMRIFLDSRLRVKLPAMTFKIDNTVVRQMKITSTSLPPMISQDGVYAISRLRYTGDTRGNEWYTDVTGITSLAGVLAALAWEQSLRGK
jgi:hypothetical protein